MLRFHSFSWNNYFTWRSKKPTRLNLDNQGLVQLSGANGVGKSSIFNALATLLYGRSISKKLKASDISSFVGDIDFSVSGRKYHVGLDRHGKSAKYTIIENGVDVSPKKERSTDIYGVLEEILGVSLLEFTNTVYIPQRDMHLLIDADPKPRREFVSKLFGVDVLDEMLDTLHDKSKTNSSDIRSIEDDELMLTSIDEELSNLPSMEDIKNKKKHLVRRRESLEDSLSEVDSKISKLLVEMNTSKEKQKILTIIGEVQDASVVELRITKAKSKLRSVTDMISKLSSKKKLEQRIESLTKDLNSLGEPKKANAKRVSKLKSKIRDIENSVSTFKKARLSGNSCPTCLQDISREYAESLKQKIYDLTTTLGTLSSELRTEEELVGIQSKRDLLVSRLNELQSMSVESVDTSTLGQLLLEEQKLEDKVQELTDLLGLLKRLDDIGEVISVDVCKKRGMALESDKSALQKELQSVNSDLGQITIMRESLDKLLTRRAQVEKRIKKGKSVRDSQMIYSALTDSLSKRKIDILNEATAAIASRLPYHIDTLFPEPGIDFVLECTKRSFRFDVSRFLDRRGGTKETYDVATLSGGEKGRLSLAILFALHDISRVTTCNLLILDEPDKHLDDEGREGFAQKLLSFKSKKGTVIVTSHSSSLSESDLYDKSYKVSLKGNSSRLKLVQRETANLGESHER